MELVCIDFFSLEPDKFNTRNILVVTDDAASNILAVMSGTQVNKPSTSTTTATTTTNMTTAPNKTTATNKTLATNIRHTGKRFSAFEEECLRIKRERLEVEKKCLLLRTYTLHFCCSLDGVQIIKNRH